MPLIFKLVGFVINNKYYQIKDNYQGQINLFCIHSLFENWGLTHEEAEQVKFIIDSEQLKDPNKIYQINQDEIYNIFVFVFNQEIRKKLEIIFTTYGSESINIDEPVTQTENESFVLTRENIELMNEQTLLLFSDPDFIIILNIYKRKPELFNLLSNYIQNNDIIDALISDKTIDQISEEEKEYYTKLSIKIMDLNLNIPENIIIENLIKFSGHLNLTIRSILNI